MSVKLFAAVSLAVWLLTATSTLSQSNRYVVDTNGDHLESDEEYYIRPAITDNGGRFTLINRNQSCPLYVGLENTDLPQGYPVRFTPFANDEDDDEVKVNRDLKVEFVEVSSTCVQSTEWRLGENDTRSGRRLIVTGRDDGISSARNYFRIEETENANIYNIAWCPTEVCPTCRFICGTGGILRENGQILFALDGSALPVVFQKKDD
ncbi:endogenous alpha-amylase/subtilisin inhibitor [Vigna radiata var. radiata]|uniref:Endogenous alpha-amylase/subtilisin inhibitor n=1 Tax=Vigna radiata var. radiata TaxID=3916 RepID=A0A1S3TI38_VIGRR|nr:endogenous alpha-amylase/subtilisin inhibitor [Vigna radiata var. radiata]